MVGNHKRQTYTDCLECGERFGPIQRLTVKFCSQRCSYDYKSKQPSKLKGRIRPNLYRAKTKTCIVCKKLFRAILENKSRIVKYCSKECWSKRDPPINKTCIYCNKEFITYNYRKQKYCGSDCRNKDYKNRFNGSKSHLWKGGKTAFHILRRKNASYKEWRFEVMKRDNFTCILCGQKGKGLEADHIKPVSEYPELIYDINNGRTLCHECHKQTETYGHKQYKKLYSSSVIIKRWENYTGQKAIKLSI